MSRVGVLAHIVVVCVIVSACGGGRGGANSPSALDFCPSSDSKMKPIADCIDFVKDATPEKRAEAVRYAVAAVCDSFASLQQHDTKETLAFEKKEKMRFCCEYGARTEFDRSRPEFEQKQSLVRLACARTCFVGGEANACKFFDGPEGEKRRFLACANSGEEAVCRGIDPGEVDRFRAEQRAKSAAEYSAMITAREERNRQIIANNAAIRADLASKAAAQRARSEPPVVQPVRTTPRKNCQYMFLTGGRTSSGWEKVERHFYDAPDCGGSCCSGQSFCCVERTSGKEFCSGTANSSRLEPEAHSCSGAAYQRDQRRDDYPVIPIIPGE